MSDRSAGDRADCEQDAKGILAAPLNDQLRFGYEIVHAGTVSFSLSTKESGKSLTTKRLRTQSVSPEGVAAAFGSFVVKMTISVGIPSIPLLPSLRESRTKMEDSSGNGGNAAGGTSGDVKEKDDL